MNVMLFDSAIVPLVETCFRLRIVVLTIRARLRAGQWVRMDLDSCSCRVLLDFLLQNNNSLAW